MICSLVEPKTSKKSSKSGSFEPFFHPKNIQKSWPSHLRFTGSLWLNPSPKPISSQFQESFQCQFQRGAPGGTIHPAYIAGGKLRKCYGNFLDLIHSNRLKLHDGKKNTWWIWMYIVYHWLLSASEVYAFLVDQAQPEFDQGARLTNHPIHSTSSKSTWICAFMVPDPKAW